MRAWPPRATAGRGDGHRWLNNRRHCHMNTSRRHLGGARIQRTRTNGVRRGLLLRSIAGPTIQIHNRPWPDVPNPARLPRPAKHTPASSGKAEQQTLPKQRMEPRRRLRLHAPILWMPTPLSKVWNRSVCSAAQPAGGGACDESKRAPQPRRLESKRQGHATPRRDSHEFKWLTATHTHTHTQHRNDGFKCDAPTSQRAQKLEQCCSEGRPPRPGPNLSKPRAVRREAITQTQQRGNERGKLPHKLRTLRCRV